MGALSFFSTMAIIVAHGYGNPEEGDESPTRLFVDEFRPFTITLKIVQGEGPNCTGGHTVSISTSEARVLCKAILGLCDTLDADYELYTMRYGKKVH